MSALKHLRQLSSRHQGPPPAVAAMARAKRLLAGTLMRTRRPKRLPEAMRLQILGLTGHWFAMRLRGEVKIYPGIERMMEWGLCGERTARSNVGDLKNWGVLIPVAHEKGGAGKATEFVFSIQGLLRVLITMGANPHPSLWEALAACDEPTKNPAILGIKMLQFQQLSGGITEVENPAMEYAENPAIKGATVAPRFLNTDRVPINPTGEGLAPDCDEDRSTSSRVELPQDCLGNALACLPEPTAPQGEVREPPAGRSADASLGFSFLEKKNDERGACAEAPADAASETQAGLSGDARVLIEHLAEVGPATFGAAASSLRWTPTRVWVAEAELKAAGLIYFDGTGLPTISPPPGVMRPTPSNGGAR